MMLSWAVILPVIIVVAVLALRARSSASRFIGRRPKPRHIAVRIVCGALGAGLLVAVGVATIIEARSCYKGIDVPPKEITVKAPTLPTPTPKMPRGRVYRMVDEDTRVLVGLLVVDTSTGEARVVGGKQRELHWPKDDTSHEGIVCDFDAHGYTLSAHAQLRSVEARVPQQGAAPIFEVVAEVSVEVRQSNSRFYSSTSVTNPGSEVLNASTGGRETSSIFAVPSIAGTPTVWCLITPVAADDPLKEVPASTLLTAQLDKMNRSVVADAAVRANLPTNDVDWGLPARGVLLAMRLGFATLSLLIAGILLTQVFTHRVALMPVIFAGLVLYAAALDRTTLGMHLSRLDDKSAPFAARFQAAVQSTNTFFFGHTADEHLVAVAGDESAPWPLRRMADQAAERIETRESVTMLVLRVHVQRPDEPALRSLEKMAASGREAWRRDRAAVARDELKRWLLSAPCSEAEQRLVDDAARWSVSERHGENVAAVRFGPYRAEVTIEPSVGPDADNDIWIPRECVIYRIR